MLPAKFLRAVNLLAIIPRMPVTLFPPLRRYHRSLMMIAVDIGLVARHAHGLIVACVAPNYPRATPDYDGVCLLHHARLYLDSRPMPHVFGMIHQRVIVSIEIP